MSAPIVLKAEKLVRRLPGLVPVTLVDSVSVRMSQGEFVAITGPSGSGKSSLLYLLGLLDRPDSGDVILNGQSTANLGDDALAALRLSQIGFVFQFHFLLPEFSALENVMLPMRRLGRLSEAEVQARAEKLLTDFGLKEKLNNRPAQLSGGQSQRVAIARALANNPPLILADEPTGNLDSASSATVQGILHDLAHVHGRTVVVVTHEQAFAKKADRIVHIVDGKIASDGPT